MRQRALILFVFGLNHAFGQVEKQDTILVRQIEEVAIPGTRTRSRLDRITARFAPNLSRILNQSSEIYLRQYGPSGVSSMSLNGLGAAQTSLEWNGVPLNSPLLGQADANQFAAGGGSISRGSSTAFSATQAAGLSLCTVRPDSGKMLSLGAESGTYGLINTQGGLGFRQGRWSASSRFQWNEARNDYKVKDPTRNDTLFRLPNARAFRRQAEGHLWHDGSILSAEVHAFTALWGRHLAPSTQSLQLQTKESLYGRNSAITLSEIYDKGRDSAQASYALAAEEYRYSFPAGQPPSGRFAFARQQARAAYFRRWVDDARAGLQYELVKEQTPDLESVGRRARYLHYLTPSVMLAGQQLDGGLILFRQQIYFIPKLFLQRQGFHVLARRTFRAPTFNDLYYPVYGRVGIQPERATHLEAGLNKTLLQSEKFSIKVSEILGHYRFTNYIQWTPIANQYTPNNLVNISNMYLNTKIITQIVFSKISLLISNFMSLSRIGNSEQYFSWPQKQLIYTPFFQNGSSATVLAQNWQIGLNGKHTSSRYFTSDNSKQHSLLPFYLANAHAAYTATLTHLQITGFANFGNLLGTEYAYIQDYPMPRYEFSIGLQMEIRR